MFLALKAKPIESDVVVVPAGPLDELKAAISAHRHIADAVAEAQSAVETLNRAIAAKASTKDLYRQIDKIRADENEAYSTWLNAGRRGAAPKSEAETIAALEAEISRAEHEAIRAEDVSLVGNAIIGGKNNTSTKQLGPAITIKNSLATGQVIYGRMRVGVDSLRRQPSFCSRPTRRRRSQWSDFPQCLAT